MTSYVPLPGMPQAYQMISHPTIPFQQPLLQHNPLVNPLCEISGRNRTVQDVFNDHLQLHEEACQKQEKRYKEE